MASDRAKKVSDLTASLKLHLEGKLPPTRLAQLVRTMKQKGFQPQILDDKRFVAAVIKKLEGPTKEQEPQEDSDAECGICAGPGGETATCCSGVICKDCNSRTEKCPYCTKSKKLSIAAKEKLAIEKAEHELAEKLKGYLVDQLASEMINLYNGDLQESLDAATRYYDQFSPLLETLVGSDEDIYLRFRLFAAMMITGGNRDRIPDFLAILSDADDDKVYNLELVYLEPAGFQVEHQYNY